MEQRPQLPLQLKHRQQLSPLLLRLQDPKGHEYSEDPAQLENYLLRMKELLTASTTLTAGRSTLRPTIALSK
jgi:hypothetical protein